jgi:uncharacterized membrane protein
MPGDRARVFLAGLLFLAYPLIIFFLLRHEAAGAAAALLVAVLAWRLRYQRHRLVWLGVAVLSVLLVLLLFDVAVIPKLLPPLIHAGLFYMFSTSLGSVPLIERFARLERPELPQAVVAYCRRLTVMWSGFFAVNVALTAWLALGGDDVLWVLYNGLLVYLLIAALLVGEALWRRHRFPELGHASIVAALGNIMLNAPAVFNLKKQNDTS